MWFETHAHLSDSKFDPDRDDTVVRAFSSGVSHLVEIADGPDEWEKARGLAEKYPGKMWWAAGIHPYYADQGSPAVFAKLKDHTRHPQFVAIGEVGLDYAKCQIPHDVQIKTLETALSLAIEVKKPLVIHCREAFEDLMPVFRKYFVPKPADCPGVIHCFSGNTEQAKELIGMGFFLGVDGPITYPNSHSLRETLAGLSPENLVLETDSPYLPPQTMRGKRNEPSYLPLIGQHLAQILKIAPASLATILRQNSCTLFRID